MQIHEGLLYTCSGDRTIRAFCLSVSRAISLFGQFQHAVYSLIFTSRTAAIVCVKLSENYTVFCQTIYII